MTPIFTTGTESTMQSVEPLTGHSWIRTPQHRRLTMWDSVWACVPTDHPSSFALPSWHEALPGLGITDQ